jgi:cell cycle arrest protein BUB3
MKSTSKLGEWPDGVTAVKFSPLDPGSLIVSCWDGTVTLVDVISSARQSVDLFSPVLDTCWLDANIYAGTLSGSFCMIQNSNVTTIGHHDLAISALALGLGTVITGSWDKSLKFWDVRSRASDAIDLPNKCFSLSSVNNTLVCGMSDRLIHIYDLRMLKTPVAKESSLKHMTRRVCVMPNEKGFATCSIEGRVAIDYFGTEQGKYAFKCHRKKIQGVEHVYPVNAVCFNPV